MLDLQSDCSCSSSRSNRKTPLQTFRYSPSIVILLAMATFVLCGCGGTGDQPELGKVSGVITLDGAPLADANVEFRPERGRPSSAITTSDGNYVLLYTKDTQGALIGIHSVLISTQGYAPQPDGSTIPVPEKIPAKYHQETTLTREVKAGTNQFDFDLTSK